MGRRFEVPAPSPALLASGAQAVCGRVGSAPRKSYVPHFEGCSVSSSYMVCEIEVHSKVPVPQSDDQKLISPGAIIFFAARR